MKSSEELPSLIQTEAKTIWFPSSVTAHIMTEIILSKTAQILAKLSGDNHKVHCIVIG
jgi:hypothetical protein